MNISENLPYLRKREKFTQEELAERLGVSRQSVSKWETGEAYPETDKLLALCDLFHVTLDELMREDLTKQRQTAEEQTPPVDEATFSKEMNAFSRAIALGVFLILFGTAICVAISGVSFLFLREQAELYDIFAGVTVLLFVAAAVFLFVFFGIKHDRFRKEHPVIEEIYSKETVDKFLKKFNAAMPCLITGILLDVALLIVLTATFPYETETCFFTAGFLSILSVIVSLITYFGIQRSKYDVAEYNKQTKKDFNGSPRTKLANAICGSVMMLATALFLVFGFVGNWWHPGWIVFPVGGILCGIIHSIFDAKGDDK